MAYIVVDVAFGPLIRQESEVLGEANVALTMTPSLLSEHIISPSLHRHERTAPDQPSYILACTEGGETLCRQRHSRIYLDCHGRRQSERRLICRFLFNSG